MFDIEGFLFAVSFGKRFILCIYFDSVYVNPGYSNEFSSFLGISEPDIKPHNQILAAPNFGNSENTSNDTTTVTQNVNFVDEDDSPTAQVRLETDSESTSGVGEKSDTESTTHSNNLATIPLPTDTDSIKSNETSTVANGNIENGVTSHHDPVPSHAAKRKSFGVRYTL